MVSQKGQCRVGNGMMTLNGGVTAAGRKPMCSTGVMKI